MHSKKLRDQGGGGSAESRERDVDEREEVGLMSAVSVMLGEVVSREVVLREVVSRMGALRMEGVRSARMLSSMRRVAGIFILFG